VVRLAVNRAVKKEDTLSQDTGKAGGDTNAVFYSVGLKRIWVWGDCVKRVGGGDELGSRLVPSAHAREGTQKIKNPPPTSTFYLEGNK